MILIDKQLYFISKKGLSSCKIQKNIILLQRFHKESTSLKEFGEVAEWSIAAVLKTVELRGSRGSNPCLSAIKKSLSFY